MPVAGSRSTVRETRIALEAEARQTELIQRQDQVDLQNVLQAVADIAHRVNKTKALMGAWLNSEAAGPAFKLSRP